MNPQTTGAIPAISVIVITGPVGAGKTTTAGALSELMRDKDISHALVDVDEIRYFHPEAPDDPFNHRIAMKNIASLSETYRESGARWLIFADVIEHDGHKEAYRYAIPNADISVVRLHVDIQLVIARLKHRGSSESPSSVAWYLNRAPELQGIMDRGKVEDVLIDVGERSPHDVALEILRRVGVTRNMES